MKFKVGDKVSVYEINSMFVTHNPRYFGTVEYALNGEVHLKSISDIFRPDKHGTYKNQDKTLIIHSISEYEKQQETDRKNREEKEQKLIEFMEELSDSLSGFTEYQLLEVKSFVQLINSRDDE